MRRISSLFYSCMAYPITRRIFGPFLRTFITSVSGTEYIPKNEPFILVSNHISQVDPLFLTITILPYCDNRKVHFISVQREMPQWVKKHIAEKWAACILLDTQNKSASIDQGIEVLQGGGVVGIFPEGTRNPYEHMISRGHTGAIRMALATGITIIPVGIHTDGESHKRNKHNHIISDWKDAVRNYIFKKNHFDIVIGRPISLKKTDITTISYETLRTETDTLMETISTLSKRPYRSKYIPLHFYSKKS